MRRCVGEIREEMEVRGDTVKLQEEQKEREKRGGVTRFVPRSREHSKVCGTADGEAASHSRLEPV